MATENEQLKITALFVDETAGGVAKLQEHFKQVGGAEQKKSFEQFQKHTKETSRHLRPLTDDLGKATERMLPFMRGMGGVATGVLAFAAAIMVGVNKLNTYSTELARLRALSSQTGFNAATIKSMTETFAQDGVGADQAQRNISGLAHAMADITRINSDLRNKLLAGQAGASREGMEAFLGDLGKLLDQPEVFANRVKEAADDIYKNIEKEFGPQRAAEARRNFLALFGAPDLDQLIAKFHTMNAAERKALEERIQQGMKFMEVTNKIAQSWSKITDALESEAMKALTPELERVNTLVERIGAEVGGFEGFFKPLTDFVSTTRQEVEAIVSLINTVSGLYDKYVPDSVKKILGYGATAAGNVLNPLGSAKAKLDEALGIKPDSEKGATAPLRFAGGEANRVADDQLRVTRDLASEFQKLNDFLQLPGSATSKAALAYAIASTGGGVMRGLGGLPGMGTSGPGGGAGAGAAAPGGPANAAPAAPARSHPTGSDVGAGTGDGAGQTPAQGLAGPQPGPAPFSVGGGRHAAVHNPQLENIIRETSRYLPEGWKAQLVSGYRPGQGQSFHGKNLAVDIQLYDPQGNKVPWYQNPAAFRTYQAFATKAREVQKRMYPELTQRFAWGGYFGGPIGPGGQYGAMDLMHFDLGGNRGLAGSFEKGLSPEYMRRWGVTAPSQLTMRSDTDRALAGGVQASGSVNVTVNAPSGTKVTADGDGLFNKFDVTRRTPIEAAWPAYDK